MIGAPIFATPFFQSLLHLCYIKILAATSLLHLCYIFRLCPTSMGLKRKVCRDECLKSILRLCCADMSSHASVFQLSGCSGCLSEPCRRFSLGEMAKCMEVDQELVSTSDHFVEYLQGARYCAHNNVSSLVAERRLACFRVSSKCKVFSSMFSCFHVW